VRQSPATTTGDRPSPSSSVAADDASPARLRVGRIAGAHGLHGGLRVRPDNPESDTLEQVHRAFIEPEQGPTREYKLTSAQRLNRTTVRVTLEGLDDPDAADSLRGSTIEVALSDLPAKAPGEFYYYEVIGCAVTTTDGRRLGLIEEVFATGANDVWVVRDGTAEVLVPVIDNVVKSIDLAARMMVIEAVPGLLA
jgi:16S rRNA processing protein RimM